MGKEKRRREKSKDKDKSHGKKEKKHKKPHRKKRKHSITEEELQWVEAPPPTDHNTDIATPMEPIDVSTTIETPPKSNKKREDWMLRPPERRQRKPIQKEAPSSDDTYKPLELNPNMISDKTIQAPPKEEIKKPMLVGDGGKSWREKAKLRAKQREMEQATQSHPSRGSSVRSDRGQPERKVKIAQEASYTPEELKLPKNRVKALAMKAKLRGNMQEYERLQSLWEKSPEEIQFLSGLDASGRKIVSKRTACSGPQISAEGERLAFFSDDNRSLQELVEEERLGNYSNQTLASNIIKNKKYKEPDISKGEEYDPKLYESNSKSAKQSEEEFQAALKRKQVKADTHYQKIMDECQYCYSGKKIMKAAVISLGEFSYLSLPVYGQLVPGHCIIVPMEHCIAMRQSDENVWEEMQLFKRYLQRMFSDNGLEAVFMETACQFKKQYHTYIECIPLPKEAAEDAPFYFSKEISDSGPKWSSNPKLIHCREKGLRRSIPENFEYFYVEFATGDAFAHVIDEKFPSSFGRDVMCGILDLPYGKHIRKRVMDPVLATELLRSFLPMWKPYDFTQFLDGGEYVTENT